LANNVQLLGYVASALFFFMAIMLLLTLRQAGRVRGTAQWLWSTLVLAVGIAINTTQDRLPPVFGLVLSNVLVVLGAAMSARGTYEYRYHRLLPARWGYIGAVVLALAFAYFVYVDANASARILIVAASIIALCSVHVWVMLAGSPLRSRAAGVQHKRFRLPHAIMVMGFLTMITAFAIRACDTLTTMSPVMPAGGPARTALLFYALGTTGRVLVLIGMVLVLIDELDYALRALASRDSLTGLYNRRGFRDATRHLPLAQSSLLMLDLDHFKAVNDDFGHDQGDRVIALLARCAQATLPTNAVIARIGGEEFCALLPNASSAAAHASAELLREAFHRETAAFAHSRQHTVSIGVATADGTEITMQALTERADQALYAAKRDGRDRVAAAE